VVSSGDMLDPRFANGRFTRICHLATVAVLHPMLAVECLYYILLFSLSAGADQAAEVISYQVHNSRN